MIFMTCSTVTPGFGVRIVSTPVILGCGGVDWPCARAPGPSRTPSAGRTFQSALFSSFDSSRNHHVLVPLGTTRFRRSYKRKVASASHKIYFTPYTHGGTIRYHGRQGEGDG